MATAIASLNMAAASVPVASCAVSRSGDRAVNMSSSALFGGIRLDSATAAAPRATRSSRPFVVRAEQKPNFWEGLTSFFGSGKEKATEATAKAEKELNKSAPGNLVDKAKSIQADLQTQADEAAKEVGAGVDELKGKVEEAIEAAKQN